MFLVRPVNVTDDIPGRTMLEVTIIRVLVGGMGGSRPVTPHLGIGTANWPKIMSIQVGRIKS